MCVKSCFPASYWNALVSLFICWKSDQNAQLRTLACQSLASWRATGENTEKARQLLACWLHRLASCSPVGDPLTCNFSKDLWFAFPCSFFSFVVELGFHRASNTCPPLPTQASKRVEEFPCLKYTSIELHISHKRMISYLHHFLLVFVLLSMYHEKEYELEGNRDELCEIMEFISYIVVFFIIK